MVSKTGRHGLKVAGRPKENGLSARRNEGAATNVFCSDLDAGVVAGSWVGGVWRSWTTSDHALIVHRYACTPDAATHIVPPSPLIFDLD